MVDLETGGVDPCHNPIIQLSAVRFDYATQTVGPIFDMCLDVPGNRFWDMDTIRWWNDNKGDLLDRILARAQPAEKVWNTFVDWTMDTSPTLTDNRLWAKPISFEWPYLQSYGRQFGRELPFHYGNAIDLRSFCRGMANNPAAEALEKRMTFEGEKHNAIDDVLNQIQVAFAAKILTAETA